MNIETFENLSEALNLPEYEDFWSYPSDDVLNMAYFADKYGNDVAVKLLMIAILTGNLIATNYGYALAQSVDYEEPIVEVNFDEMVQSSDARLEENIYIEGLDSFKALLKNGMSSKNYKFNFTSENTYNDVLQYITENEMFFSTGNKMAPLDVEFLMSVWGNEYNFMVINDSQPAQVINESVSNIFLIPQGQPAPTNIISTTESIDLGGGLVKTSTTITNPTGVITNTLSYKAPWTYEASQTVTGEAIANGRYGFLATPTIKVINPADNNQKIFSINIIYTGGGFDSGNFIPNFKHEPIYQGSTGSFRFHGNAIGQNVLKSTASVDKLFIIGADSFGYYTYNTFENMFMHRFVELLNKANKTYGANYEIVFSESIGGAIDRHNAYADYWTQKNIDYKNFVTTFGAAGNNNQLVAWDTKNPENLLQVMALTPDLRALTYYTNYGIDSDLYLAGRGDFQAMIPFLSTDGSFNFSLRGMQGTSMATPLDASFYAINSFKDKNRLSVSSVFTVTNNVIHMVELSGGQLITDITTISDAELNRLLSQIPENGTIPTDGVLRFDANWASYNGRMNKSAYLPALGLSWDEYINMPTIFNTNPSIISFPQYLYSVGLPKVYLLDSNNKPIREVFGSSTPNILIQINRMENDYNLPKLTSPSFSARQLSKVFRVGPSDWPISIDYATYKYNADLIKNNFDPLFSITIPQNSHQYSVHMPIIYGK